MAQGVAGKPCHGSNSAPDDRKVYTMEYEDIINDPELGIEMSRATGLCLELFS